MPHPGKGEGPQSPSVQLSCCARSNARAAERRDSPSNRATALSVRPRSHTAAYVTRARAATTAGRWLLLRISSTPTRCRLAAVSMRSSIVCAPCRLVGVSSCKVRRTKSLEPRILSSAAHRSRPPFTSLRNSQPLRLRLSPPPVSSGRRPRRRPRSRIDDNVHARPAGLLRTGLEQKSRPAMARPRRRSESYGQSIHSRPRQPGQTPVERGPGSDGCSERARGGTALLRRR